MAIKLVRELAAETVDLVELVGKKEKRELQLAMTQYKERTIARRKEGAKFR